MFGLGQVILSCFSCAGDFRIQVFNGEFMLRMSALDTGMNTGKVEVVDVIAAHSVLLANGLEFSDPSMDVNICFLLSSGL